MTKPASELIALQAERAELIAKNEAATSWGAAVGARSERIKEIDGLLAAAKSGSERAGVDALRPWTSQRARTLIHIACGGAPVCSITVSANHIHEDYPGCKKDWIARQEAFAAFIIEACNSGGKTTRDETGWLIEKGDPPVYHLVTSDHDEHWSTDASKALRFARREDAQAYSDHIGWTSPPVRVVEHMWSDGKRATPPAQPAPEATHGKPDGAMRQLEPWQIELDEVIGHLGAAIHQSVASDDQIIMNHIKAAHEIAKIVRRKA